MPIPVGQSCENCYFWNAETGGEESPCMWRPPDEFRNNRWQFRRTAKNKWCGQWRDASGSGIGAYDSGIGYRGVSRAGEVVSPTMTYALLAPTFASTTETVGWTLQANGIIEMNNPNIENDASVLVETRGICTFQSDSNNEDIELTLGSNGVPDDRFMNKTSIKTNGFAGVVPVTAQMALSNGDTVGLYIRSETQFTGKLITYHLLATSVLMLAYGGDGGTGKQLWSGWSR